MAQTAKKTDPVYDNDDDQAVTRPDLRALEGGRQGDGVPRGNLRPADHQPAQDGGLYNPGGDGSSAPDDLKTSEESPDEADGGFYNPEGNGKKRKIRGRFRITRRQATIGGGLLTILVGGGIGFFSIIQGPFEFVHAAQLFMKSHFRSNEDFGDNRAERMLLYKLSGEGSENARLGRKMNKVADRWEAKLLKDTGLRPVYSSTTRRFVGFEIADEDKAFRTILANSDKDKKTTKALENAMGNGAEIRTAGEASSGRQKIVRGQGGGELDGKSRIIDLRNVKSYGQRARFIKTIGSFTDSRKIVSTIGSRLLIKRAGVDFHPLKNIKRKLADNLFDYRQKRREEKAKLDQTGESTELKKTTGEDGKPNQTAEVAAGTDEANEAIEQAKNSVGKDAVKKIAGKLSKSGTVGVLCAARSLGKDVAKFKYANNALPMIRMGMGVITMGNQVMDGKDVNLDELGAFSKQFYNKDDGTTWTDARSIQAQTGRAQTGPDLPPEAQLKNVGSKPKLFNALDKTPVLGTACGALNTVSGLPIIGGALNFASGVLTSAIDGIASIFGTSSGDLMTRLLSAVAGKSVDTLASGAEFGSLADTGAFLAANDNAISMGGAALSGGAVAELKAQQKIADAGTMANQSFSQKYLDPYNSNSLVASLLGRMPMSFAQLKNFFANLPGALFGGFSSLAGSLSPGVSAASSGYDYGVPKFGFSVDELQDSRFENPYQNAKIIEQPGVLDSLNDKYGKPCFGMTVTSDNSGVHIESESLGSDDLNVFELVQGKRRDKCDPARNKDPMYLRYRFYLADSVAAESLDCFQSDTPTSDQSCSDVGFQETSSATADNSLSSGSLPSGSAQELAKQLLPYIKDGRISCNGGQGANCPDIQGTAKGTSIKNASCNVDSLAPNLVGLLLYLVQQGHTFILSAICSDHPSNPTSLHHQGRGVDFNYIDGVYMGPSPTARWDSKKLEAARKLDRDAASVLPKSSEILQQNCGADQFSFLSGFKVGNDLCHHQHIGVGE